MSDVTVNMIRRAVAAAADGDAAVFKATIDELQHHDWDKSEFQITEALFIAVEQLPSVTPDTAASLTRHLSERFEGALSIVRPMMEAVVRGASGEEGVSQGIPRNVALIYSLLTVGQIVHEEYLTVDEALGSARHDSESDVSPGNTNEAP